MRLGYDRDVGYGEARVVRRRPLRPDPRDWYGTSDVGYPVPPRTRIEEVQRPSRRTPRGYAKSSRSLDAYPPAMPPPAYLTRASTDAYKRRPGFSVYEPDDDDDSSDEHYRPAKPRGRYEERARPRQLLRKPREPTPESTPPTESEEDSDSSDEDEDDDDDDDDDDSNQIEVVVEEADDDDHKRHRHRRRPSRDDYITSSDDKRSRRRHRLPSPSTSDDIEIAYPRQASSERGSPDRRPPLRREVSDTPRHSLPQRYTSVIGTSRPPVASRRATKVYESREIIREIRPRRSGTIQTVRQSRSSSRRPPSITGSHMGGSSRNTSPDRPAKLRDCKGCLDEVPISRCPKLECGHRMCHSCLKRRFKQSVTDPQQHMPPTCCAPDNIPLEHVDKLFDATFKKLWNKKFVEYSVRNRLYCPSRRCGEWIRPANIFYDRDTGREAARCERCNTKVCGACNGRWHFMDKCPRDEETAIFLDRVRHEGRRRCYRCGASAELREGDNHAACRCGAKFCLVCGEKPKRCECPWFDPNNPDSDSLEHMNGPALVRRGEIQVFREEAPPAAPEEPRAARRPRGSARPRKKIYDEEAIIRQQEHREEEMARRPQYYGKEDDYDAMAGGGDMVGPGNPPGQLMPDNYRRTGRRVVGGAPPSPARPGFEINPPGDYYAGDQSRGAMGAPVDRRLADRFAEGRYGPMPGMEPPPGMMGSSLMPPPIGMPPPVRDTMYHGGGMGPHERVIVERDPNNYDDNDSYYSHSSRSRKSGRRSETPKSSELAGLSGRGTGMGRIDVWRKFVEPGDPEGEIAAAAAAAAAASA
ncbi:e3 ubiquitin- ligase arih1l [Fusarium albosuccineum]|uniref:E3 ubiquitin- ligase arih1l n=1 Tax=Fusarium albosuccineum TaxID=1237068 RepID=A0A8H4LGF8_9HYPO|nr:e3 ubiquitin- ligase arih1l [Fusarium albosuccineum]